MTRYLLVFLLVSCSRHQFEIEALADDVLRSKTKEGIEIQVFPIPPTKELK